MNDEELIKKINVNELRVLCQKYDDADGGLPNCQGEGMELYRFFHRLIYAHKKK
jgi:hypothetical protein